MLDELETLIRVKLCKRSKYLSNVINHILICGDENSGKTTLFEFLSKRLNKKYLIFCHYIDCNNFKGLFVFFFVFLN